MLLQGTWLRDMKRDFRRPQGALLGPQWGWSAKSSGSNNKSFGIMILPNKRRFLEGSCSKVYSPGVKLWEEEEEAQD